MSMQEIQVRTPDGARLCVRVQGKGDTPILFCNGIGVSSFFWDYYVDYFSDKYRIVTWDYRGHGASSKIKKEDSPSFQGTLDDLHCVVQQLDLRKVILVGHSMGAHVVIAYALQNPSRISAIVPMLGTYGHPLNTFFDSGMSRHVFNLLAMAANRKKDLTRLIWQAVNRLSSVNYFVATKTKIINGDFAPKSKFNQYFNHLSVVDGVHFIQLLADWQNHTSEPQLGEIKSPTLIVAGTDDKFTPMWLSRHMQVKIPRSDLLVIPNGSHAAIVEQPELIALRMEKFLNERVSGKRRGRRPENKTNANNLSSHSASNGQTPYLN